jgi:hypothetical protein
MIYHSSLFAIYPILDSQQTTEFKIFLHNHPIFTNNKVKLPAVGIFFTPTDG